jgi:hypothetical protein
MKIGEYIELPKNISLTEIGVKHEKQRGNNIPLSKYKILNIYWEQCEYPHPHSCKRIELKKDKSKITNIKYAETVESILLNLNQKN